MTDPYAAPHTANHATAITDLRNVPLNRVPTDRSALRRIVPADDTTRVPVAAFNASL